MNPNRVRLADPTPDFNRFADDQVLTAAQLNGLIDYLVDQQRGTRAHLLGSGILCGLELSRQGDNVTLSQGVGLSSDGGLMAVRGDRVFDRFLQFQDDEADYAPWRPGGNLLPMWELHEANSQVPGLIPMGQFDAQGGGFANVQAVLYLEHYLDPFALCDANDCDNRGPREAFNPRVLLVQRSPGLVDPLPDPEYFQLPRIRVPRLSLANPDVDRYDTANGLASLFVAAIGDLRGQLSAALAQAAGGAFGPFIAELQGQDGDWIGMLANDVRFNPENDDRRVQYVYAFFKDLADAYHEWRECLLDLQADCLPDPGRHPRHLLLGEPVANPDPERRHRYHPGPVERRNDAALDKAQLLLRRIHQMLSVFDPPQFPNANAIRLTPSKSDAGPLGERAIPFYYRASDQRPLFRSWDPEATRRRRERDIPS